MISLKNRQVIVKITYPRFLRKKNIIIILSAYIMLCCLYYYFFRVNWLSTKAFFDSQFEEGFALSLSSSLLDDLIVFLALTLLITILTTKDIIDEKFESKIRAIINSEQAQDNNTIMKYLHNNVSKLIVYDKFLEFYISIADYSSPDTAYKLYIEYKFHTVNMCKDKEFDEQNFNFYISKSDTVVNEYHGYVTLVETSNPSGNVPPTNFVNGSTQHKLDKEYDEDIPLSVPKNGEMLTTLKFNCWSKTGDDSGIENVKYWNNFRVHKYSEGICVVLNNMYNKSVKYRIDTINKENYIPLPLEGILSSGEEKTIPIDCLLYPGDNVRVYFYQQEERSDDVN